MSFQTMTDIMEFAKLMSISGVAVPKHLRDNPGACLAVVIQASEWQMSPYAVANKSYSVNDRLAYESQLVSAVILRRAPIKTRFQYAYAGDGDKRVCTVTVTTTDGEVVTHSSPMFGLITPKNSPLWKSDPDQQLGYHTARALCRRHFPDVLLGVYTMDEMQDAPPAPRQATGRVVVDSPKLTDSYEPQDATPNPEPSPSLEPVPESPVEVSEATERAQLIEDIKATLKTQGTTIAKYAAICKKHNFLAEETNILDAPIQALRIIRDNVVEILVMD